MDSTPTRTFNSVYNGSDCYYGLEVRPEFSTYFADKNLKGRQALDIGCGEGRYALYLAARGCQVSAVDCARVGLEKLEQMAAKKKLPIQTHQRDLNEFELPTGAFDVIVAATILDHLSIAGRRRTINGIKSALKPGGILYANVFTVADPGYELKKTGEGAPSTASVSETAACMAHYFARQELKNIFSDLSIIDYHETVEPDHSHGRPHFHGWACLLARKPEGGQAQPGTPSPENG